MFSPGAPRSTAAFAFEKFVGAPAWLIAAIVSTCGYEAGNSGGLPSASSLPAEATGIAPSATAAWRARYSASQGDGDP